MPRGADRNSRAEARRIFGKHYATEDDYRAAAAAAGVSPRTGRRWRDEIEGGRAKVAAGLTHDRALTRFFGRDRDLKAIRDHFDEGARMVTVVGHQGSERRVLPNASRKPNSTTDRKRGSAIFGRPFPRMISGTR